MTPTEQEGTVAVDAAARTAWDLQRKAAEAAGVPTAGPWENLSPLDQNYYREAVLPLVWAALEALPDRRAAAWREGHTAGVGEARGEDETPNPYQETP